MHEIENHNLLNRLENIEKIEMDKRLQSIEHQLKFFSQTFSSMNKCFNSGIQISVDNQVRNIVDSIKKLANVFMEEVNEIRKLRYEIQQELNVDSVSGTLKFMAKALHELTQTVNSMKEKGLKKDIHLALTLDGYEMVKKKPSKENSEIEFDEGDEKEALRKLLSTLSEREQKVLRHRFGLLGEKKKTLKETGELFGISAGWIGAVQSKAIRKCRHPSRKKLVEEITHLELMKAILDK